jgi:hypothetical protein
MMYVYLQSKSDLEQDEMVEGRKELFRSPFDKYSGSDKYGSHNIKMISDFTCRILCLLQRTRQERLNSIEVPDSAGNEPTVTNAH